MKLSVKRIWGFKYCEYFSFRSFFFQIWVFNCCHNLSFTFRVLLQFNFLSFLTISFLEFGAIWVLSFVVIWVFFTIWFEICHKKSCWVFGAIWDLKFCHNFHNWDFWFLSQLEVLSFVTIFFLLLSQWELWGLSQFKFFGILTILVLSQVQSLSFLPIWVLSQLDFFLIFLQSQFLSFVTIWVFEFCHDLSFWILSQC